MSDAALNDDALIPGIELTQWRAGRVLTQEDEDLLMRYLREVDEEENRQVDAHHEARVQVLMELGGEELVKAFEADSIDSVNRAIQGALKRYYERRAALRAASN